jgi:O-acetyl-ADP-ribose deacetylase (regulator of RNase III)
MTRRIKLIQGDITKIEVDAIVNAANTSLLGGGGVDGAIHRAAGPELLEACRLLGGCKTGEAKVTKGFKLPAKFIIHTVGPVWREGIQDEEQLLAACYRNSLQLAAENGCKTVAFPNISTGVYHFPKDLAAKIAVREVTLFLEKNKVPETVVFVCFDKDNFDIYNGLINSQGNRM